MLKLKNGIYVKIHKYFCSYIKVQNCFNYFQQAKTK